MKVIKSSVEDITPTKYDLISVHKHIEKCARTCYKSMDKVTDDSYIKFCEMLKTNKHCYDKNMEVLTKHGWIKWEDYSGEPVAVINHDRTFKGWELPTNIIKQEYTGNYYTYPEYGIKVTDGHTMFGVFRDSNNDFYNNDNYEKFKCNTSFTTPNKVIKTLGERHFKSPSCCMFNNYKKDAYYELVGFWLGDGIRENTTKHKIKFHLNKKRKIEYLKSLSATLNLEFKELANSYYTITQDNIGELFNSKYIINNRKAIIEELDINQAYAVIQGLLNSDGSHSNNTKTIRFDTTSVYLATFMQKYLTICGYSFDYKCLNYGEIENYTHRFHILNKKYLIFNDSRVPTTKAVITKETNTVYCVTVSTGLIMVRGNKKYSVICGNCSTYEHGTVYLFIKVNPYEVPSGVYNGWLTKSPIVDKYIQNPYSKVVDAGLDDDKNYGGSYHDLTGENANGETQYCITTNMRVIIENGWEDDLKYLCEPTEYHEKRYTFKVVLDRAMLAEFTRHRTLSFSVESQRYINYSKDRFGGEITVVQPHWFESEKSTEESDNLWYSAMLDAEQKYLTLIEQGLKPQDARTVLPNSVKTEMMVTGFKSDWKHFLELRSPKYGASGVHPDIAYIADLIYEYLCV